MKAITVDCASSAYAEDSLLSCIPAFPGVSNKPTSCAITPPLCILLPGLNSSSSCESLMQNTFVVLDANLVAEEYLRTISFPPSIAGGGEHEATSGVDVDGTDDSSTVTRHDREGHRLVSRLGLGEIIDTEDVLRST